MITMTADETLQSRLGGLHDEVEIRDAGGKVLGYFTPAAVAESELYRLAKQQFDPEMTERRKASFTHGFTTQEVLNHLKVLEANECATR